MKTNGGMQHLQWGAHCMLLHGQDALPRLPHPPISTCLGNRCKAAASRCDIWCHMQNVLCANECQQLHQASLKAKTILACPSKRPLQSLYQDCT